MFQREMLVHSFMMIFLVEQTRVKLWPYANVEGSDYINASFIDGYQQREAYILTQSPLENTVEEFWRMLWEYEVFTIVMISSGPERSKVRQDGFVFCSFKEDKKKILRNYGHTCWSPFLSQSLLCSYLRPRCRMVLTIFSPNFVSPYCVS